MSGPRATAEPGAGTVAWGTWALALALLLGLVARFGSRVPRWDDYDALPAAVGAAPISVGWLVSPHNEHRVILPRLVLVGMAKLLGPDARVGMVLSVLALGAAAAGLLRALVRMPGGLRAGDAVIPLLLLNPGHHGNLLWSWQVQFTMATALALALAALAIRAGDGPIGPRAGGLVGAALVLLALCGANGLAVVPAGVLWLGAEAIRHGRAGRRRTAAVLGLALLPAALLVAALLATAPRAVSPGGALPLRDVGRTLVQYAAISLGPAGASAWVTFGAMILLADTVAVAGLAWAIVRRPQHRSTALGLLALLLGSILLAAAVAWGRAGAGPRAGLEDRYVTIALPLTLLPLLAARALLGETAARIVLTFALMGACLLAWPNSEAALAAGHKNADGFTALDRDLAAGMTESQLLRRHVPFLHPSQEALAPMLPLLRRSGLGRLGQLRPDPAYREVPVGPRADRLRLARPEGDGYAITGVDPWLDYRLPAPAYVAGVRLRYDHQNATGGPAHFLMTWRGDGPASDAQRRVAVWDLPTGRDREVTLWIHDRLDEISLQPDNGPCHFRVRALTLLVP